MVIDSHDEPEESVPPKGAAVTHKQETQPYSA